MTTTRSRAVPPPPRRAAPPSQLLREHKVGKRGISDMMADGAIDGPTFKAVVDEDGDGVISDAEVRRTHSDRADS